MYIILQEKSDIIPVVDYNPALLYLAGLNINFYQFLKTINLCQKATLGKDFCFKPAVTGLALCLVSVGVLWGSFLNKNCFLELRACYGHLASFYYDKYGGMLIAVKFKPVSTGKYTLSRYVRERQISSQCLLHGSVSYLPNFARWPATLSPAVPVG